MATNDDISDGLTLMTICTSGKVEKVSKMGITTKNIEFKMKGKNFIGVV